MIFKSFDVKINENTIDYDNNLRQNESAFNRDNQQFRSTLHLN